MTALITVRIDAWVVRPVTNKSMWRNAVSLVQQFVDEKAAKLAGMDSRYRFENLAREVEALLNSRSLKCSAHTDFSDGHTHKGGVTVLGEGDGPVLKIEVDETKPANIITKERSFTLPERKTEMKDPAASPAAEKVSKAKTEGTKTKKVAGPKKERKTRAGAIHVVRLREVVLAFIEKTSPKVGFTRLEVYEAVRAVPEFGNANAARVMKAVQWAIWALTSEGALAKLDWKHYSYSKGLGKEIPSKVVTPAAKGKAPKTPAKKAAKASKPTKKGLKVGGGIGKKQKVKKSKK